MGYIAEIIIHLSQINFCKVRLHYFRSSLTLNQNIMFLSLLNDGGPVFMYPLLVILILVIILIVKGFLKKEDLKKTIKLISSITLFALVWGFLGHIIGMIGAFDAIESMGSVSQSVMAAGIKISLLVPLFGSIIFLVGRLGIIILTWMQKD